jgi:hypothetical protein
VAPTSTETRHGLALPLVLAAVAVGGVLAIFSVRTYDTLGALIVAPVLIAISVPILARQARRENDRALLSLLILALVLKLGGAVVRHFVGFDIYGGGDASAYDQWGELLSDRFRDGDFHTGLDSLTATNFIRFLTGLVYTVTGPSRMGGFLIFSWLGFWGLFLFYRAFRLAVPEGRGRSYAYLVFFLPSLLYWPSSIGKEAWMMFGLGISAFGAARILSGKALRGLLITGVGLWLTAIVRPHVAGMVGLALLAAAVIRRPSENLRLLAPLAKMVTVAVLAVAAIVLVSKTDEFLKKKGYEPVRGVNSVLGDVSEQTGQGGSAFAPSIFESPVRAPVAVGTVLFRPLLFEAHNDQALAAAIEATFLFLLSLARLPWIFAAIRSIRRQPYVALCGAFTVIFIIGFSAVANFGLLARERVQLLPFYLVLLAIPPRDRSQEPEGDRTEQPEREDVGAFARA